jgi:hypothetical protein
VTLREFRVAPDQVSISGHHPLQLAISAAAEVVELVARSGSGSSRVVQFAMLCSFVGTFMLTRLIVRMVRSGRGPFKNVKVGDVHVHHLVPGIVIMLVAGPVEFVIAPHGVARTVLACIFAAGAALTLDEFALWLHLTDVYWEDRGRKSVDAVVAISGLGTLGLVVSNPISRNQGESLWYYFGYLFLTIGFFSSPCSRAGSSSARPACCCSRSGLRRAAPGQTGLALVLPLLPRGLEEVRESHAARGADQPRGPAQEVRERDADAHAAVA